MKKILFFFMVVFSFSQPISYAKSSLSRHLVIRAIIGEAANQGEDGMYAVACAIRNRGHLKGVYGVKNSQVDNEPKWVWERAQRAWEASGEPNAVDSTFGATHWESDCFPVPYWADSMVKTIKIKNHQFYREKK